MMPKPTPKILAFDILDSTNLYLKNHYQELASHTVVVAKYQTSGYGRYKRFWEASLGDNLLFSLILKEKIALSINELSDLIVNSIISTLKEFSINVYFLYPNDIYANGKKIAGILIETKYFGKKLLYIIVGIGLNVNQEQFQNENAISMWQITNQKFDLKILLNRFLEQFYARITEYLG